MRQPLLSPMAVPALARAVAGALQAALLLVLGLAPTVFGDLHRYASADLLILVGLLIALWVVSSLGGAPLAYVRSAAHIGLWLIIALLLFQVFPLPRLGPIGQTIRSLGLPKEVLVNGGYEGPLAGRESLPVARYSLRPGSTLGVLVLVISAAGLYWVVGSSLLGRRPIIRLMWASLVGGALLALWTVIACVGAGFSVSDGVYRHGPGVPIWGGDSLVPSLLAALPLGVLVVLRHLGWMPQRPAARRQNRWAWLARSGFVRPLTAMLLVAVVAVGLGISRVPVCLAVMSVIASVIFIFARYGHAKPVSRRRAAGLILVLALWIAAGVGLGVLLRGGEGPATSLDTKLAVLEGAMPRDRAALGAGAGSISPWASFGPPAGSGVPRADSHTSGYRVLWAEIGPVGVLLVVACVAAMAVSMIRAGRRARGPWTRLAPWVALGALAANALYFAFDASGLLAPNLLAIAGVLGLVTAWRGHAALCRPDGQGEFRAGHWPLVAGVVCLLAAMGVAENEMVAGIGPDANDKFLHFGAFGLLAFVLAYALGPEVTSRYLKTRIVAAGLMSTGLGVLLEYGQRYLTAGRSFDVTDMALDALGALAMGLAWWVLRRGQSSPPVPESAGA